MDIYFKKRYRQSVTHEYRNSAFIRVLIIATMLCLSLIQLNYTASAQDPLNISSESSFEELINQGDKTYIYGINADNVVGVDHAQRCYSLAFHKALSDEQKALVANRLIKIDMYRGMRYVTRWNDYKYAKLCYEQALMKAAFPTGKYGSGPAFSSSDYLTARKGIYECIQQGGLDPSKAETHLNQAKSVEADFPQGGLSGYILALELEPSSIELQQKVKEKLAFHTVIIKKKIKAGRDEQKRQKIFSEIIQNQYEPRIASHWKPLKTDKPLKGTVTLCVHNNGTLIKVLVRESSGNADFDTAMLQAVQAAAPFAAIPEYEKYKSVADHFYLLRAFSSKAAN